MDYKLEWLSEEEGRITFFEKKAPFFMIDFFLTGENEAEFKIQDIVFEGKTTKNSNLSKEVTLKMTERLSGCFRLLWDEGLDEVVLVEPKGTKIAEILDSTKVVQKLYSEYMMKLHMESQKTTDCGLEFLELTKNEEGFECKNIEKTFFCRLLTYEAAREGARCFYLYEVEVKKKSRNKGIATKCLAGLFALLSQESPLTVYLQVGSYNEPAVHLYEKLGFDISEELGYYVLAE